MNAKPTLRLQIQIAREIDRVGNPTRLAQMIAEANKQVGSTRKVDRRTLTQLSDNPGKVTFTLDMLAALNEYFKLRGEGLDRVPILVTRGLLEPLVDAQRLVFLIGAKPRPTERRVDWSRWDGLALGELQGQTSKFNRHHEFDVQDVLWRNPVDASALKSEKWYPLLEAAGTSVISIGSPMAALSSEVMLARMFNVEPFVRPQFDVGPPLPFYFVWMPRVARGFRSAFGLTWKELGTKHGKLGPDVKANRSSAFFLDGKPYPAPAVAKAWTMYGIIAAQRRASGSVWMVVSGLAGPATLAAARLVKFVDAELPVSQHQNSPVLWMPIKAFIKVGQPSNVVSGDIREIVDVELAGDPRFWSKQAS